MCGRFAITLPADAMARMFQAVPDNALPIGPNYNVCPTNPVHVLTSEGHRRLRAFRWGFIPHWYQSPTDGPLLINARAETIANKPAFRDACRKRRCVILASGFYEWTKTPDGARLPWYIQGSAPLAFAGIYQDWGADEARVTTCAIVTCGANQAMSQIHHRMPVILDQSSVATWLGETGEKAAPLMRAAPEDALSFYRVRPRVNSNRASGPDLIDPLDA